MKTFALIPSAGSGRRFGTAKQFHLLSGKPLLLYALEVFDSSSCIGGICLIVPETEVAETEALVQKNGLKKILKVVSGGKERQDSVKKGFEAIPPCDRVIVHDGVRPFVTNKMIEEAVHEAGEFGGCVVGLPVKETMKKIGPDGFVIETVDRSTLWTIQTPQAFRYEIFKEALEKAEKDRFLGTDEAMLVERIGVKVRVIPGSPDNIKITTPEDLIIAKAILKLYKSE